MRGVLKGGIGGNGCWLIWVKRTLAKMPRTRGEGRRLDPWFCSLGWGSLSVDATNPGPGLVTVRGGRQIWLELRH